MFLSGVLDLELLALLMRRFLERSFTTLYVVEDWIDVVDNADVFCLALSCGVEGSVEGDSSTTITSLRGVVLAVESKLFGELESSLMVDAVVGEMEFVAVGLVQYSGALVSGAVELECECSVLTAAVGDSEGRFC